MTLTNKNFQHESNVELKSNSDEHIITRQIVDFYHNTLKHNPEALSYLQKRGVDTSEVVEHFKLGFSNRTIGDLLPDKTRQEGAALRGKLQRIGILKATGHELFRGSIIVPVIENGVVKQIYGRKICNRLRSGTPYHCYLPNKEQGFFNQKAIETCDEIVFCPSFIDALTFWCAGYKNVTHIYGMENKCDESILETLKTSSVKRALIAFKENEKGNQDTNTLAEQFNTIGVDCYRIKFPQGMDANDYALKN